MTTSASEQPLEVTGINWRTSIFLVATLVATLTVVPLFVWRWGVGARELVPFFVMFALTGLSISSGYHRLFTHRAYNARWPLRLGTLLFGAAAFEMSALQWSSEHRYHHKHTDHDGDPHDPHSIRRGFFWAHVGWLLVFVDPRSRNNNVEDLRRDPLVAWQDRYYVTIAIAMGFLLPMTIGGVWAAVAGGGAGDVAVGLLGGLLIAGCARIVVVQHLTFLINSAAHKIGNRPYDGESSARDSGVLALFTFGEGYHNFHHAFQTDYRNGVRAWHFDPGKWLIWLCSKVGLATNLRRVPTETIRLARVREGRRRLEQRLAAGDASLNDKLGEWMSELETRLEEQHLRCRVLLNERSLLVRRKLAANRERARELGSELRELRRQFRAYCKAWWLAYRQAMVLGASVDLG